MTVERTEFRSTPFERAFTLLRFLVIFLPWYAMGLWTVYRIRGDALYDYIGLLFLGSLLLAAFMLWTLISTGCFSESLALTHDTITYVARGRDAVTRRWEDLTVSSRHYLRFNDGTEIPLSFWYLFYPRLMQEMRERGGKHFSDTWRSFQFPLRRRPWY